MMTVTMLSGSIVTRCGSAASRSRMLAYCGWSAKQNTVGSAELTNGCQHWWTRLERGWRKASPAPTRVKTSAPTITNDLASAESDRDLRVGGFAGTAVDSVLMAANPLPGGAIAASGNPLG